MLEIVLPEDPLAAPQAPTTVRVAASQAIDLKVLGRRPAQARTVVSFDQPALEDAEGTALHSIELVHGSNLFRVRDWSAGVCHPPRGCRYLVVNSGLGQRPPATESAGVFVIERGL